MGQIETKEGDNTTNDLSDRKEIIGKSRGSTSSTDLNIKVEDNLDGNRELNYGNNNNNNEKENQRKKLLKKAKTYDFACTVFYAMVALLVFSTMSRTYTHYSGGGCGALYGAQPLLSYSCVGLACAIIRSMRKQLKGEKKENSNEADKENCEEDPEVETSEGEPYEVSTLTSKDKLNTEMNFPVNKIGLTPVYYQNDALIVNIPDPLLNVNKLPSGLPLPPLPPLPPPPPFKPQAETLKPLMDRKVSFETTNQLSPLSVADLNAVETDFEKQKNLINETHGSDSIIFKKDWKDIKFDTEMFKHRDSHKQIEYNWNDYNLNTIDKY